MAHYLVVAIIPQVNTWDKVWEWVDILLHEADRAEFDGDLYMYDETGIGGRFAGWFSDYIPTLAPTNLDGCADFRMEEFSGGYTITNLCHVLREDGFAPSDDTIEALNNLLKQDDLNSKVKQVHETKMSDLFTGLGGYFNSTTNQKNENDNAMVPFRYSCIFPSKYLEILQDIYAKDGTLHNLKWLNRITLEEYYRGETPESHIYEVARLVKDLPRRIDKIPCWVITPDGSEHFFEEAFEDDELSDAELNYFRYKSLLSAYNEHIAVILNVHH